MTPHPAATLVLTRTGMAGLEVLLLQRPTRMRFMPSFHVFPGGRVETADHRAAQEGWGGDEVGAFALAAIRETAEECGLLLAREAGGHYAGATLAASVCDALRRGADFYALLRYHDLTPDVAALLPFARWVTPVFEPRRFDTWFFLAEAPLAQRVLLDEAEAVAGGWMTPGEALARFRKRKLALAPPTLATLEDLHRADSLAEWRDSPPAPIRPILPLLVEEEEAALLVLPGDPCWPDPEPAVLAHRTRFTRDRHGRFV
jgi:8-oxo-dGTP pyrophosphatase MutT (NUDIX family)